VSAFPLVSKTSPKLGRIPEDSGGLERRRKVVERPGIEILGR
jgi:hypothetical protein